MALDLSRCCSLPPCSDRCHPMSSQRSAPDFVGFVHFPSTHLQSSVPLNSRPHKLAFDQRRPTARRENFQASKAQMSVCVGRALKWWEKGLQFNMKEIQSAQDLVDSLLTAEDKLVIVDFFSPGCGGCKSLHPKICQFAEENPDALFLQVNYEKHKSMCYALRVHVLPFFRFYRGAQGRRCSFSCTNATINKFRNALAKCKPASCGGGPAKGLEQWELVALAASSDLPPKYIPEPVPSSPQEAPDKAPAIGQICHLSIPVKVVESGEDALATAGR